MSRCLSLYAATAMETFPNCHAQNDQAPVHGTLYFRLFKLLQTEMILRVFWPDNSCGLVQQLDHANSPCLLLGAVLNSTQQAQAVTSAVVISVIPLDLLGPLLEVQQQLSHTQVALSAQHGTSTAATLAVLGVWLPQRQHHQHHLPDECTKAAAAAAAAASLHGMWLVLRGQQGLHHTLGGCSWRAQQTSAPAVEAQQCKLPPTTQSIQLMVYAVPAQQPGFAHVQLPRPPPAPQLPWMNREPGAVSLSAVMHMLQEAHAALQAPQPPQQQLLQEPKQAHAQTCQQQPQGQQLRTRQQLRRAQQQQGQQQHATAPCAANSSSARHGWSKLAAVVWSAERRRPTSWMAQRWASLVAGCADILQRMAANAPAGRTAHLTAGAETHHAHPSTAVAAGNAAGNPAAVSAAATVSTVQPYVLQLVVQHLLGLLVALNLLLHRQVVLDAAAAAGAWLQEDALQPHITWLSQAHPGGIKLHLELSLLLGTAAEACLDTAAALYHLAWLLLGPTALTATAVAAAVGGASWGCAAAADVLLVVLGPMVVVYVLAAHLLQLHLACLAATWRLIRGKQKVRRFSTHHRTAAQQQPAPISSAGQPTAPPHSNPSPSAPKTPVAAAAAAPPAAVGAEPSAGDEVSVEQLIVGVLLFTPLLGLLPTTAAWYLSACALHTGLACMRLLLLGVGSWLQLRPLHVLAARWRQPLLFPGQLMLLPFSPVCTPATTAATTKIATAVAAAADPAAGEAGGGRGGGGITGNTSSSRHEQQDGASPGSSGGADLTVSIYHVFYEPCGYWEVLVQSIAQQQGLLWYACQGPGRTEGGSWSWLRHWVRDVAVGKVWGLRMLSSPWRPL